MAEDIRKLIGLAPPPPEIFEFPLPQAVSVDREMLGVSRQGGWYFPERAEYIPGKGCFEYFREYDGHPAPALPAIRVPFWDTINLLAPLKRQLKIALDILSSREVRPLLGFSLTLGKKWRGRLLNMLSKRFNEVAMSNLQFKYLKYEYYSPPVREIIDFVERFLVLLGVSRENANRTALTIGMMFETDQAYCWRFEDAMTEATERLKTHPYEETKRLVQILIERDPAFRVSEDGHGMGGKYQAILTALKYAMYVPSVKKALINSLAPLNIEHCKLTENDIYHTLMYNSYNIQGKSPEERLKIYETYHGTDQNKWPARWSLQ